MKNKIDFINKVADLICLIRRSFTEHLTNIHPRTFVEVEKELLTSKIII
jgi:hypothetical protein